MGRLDGKVALISGGARGIGAATASAMAAEGATVVITDLLEAEGAASAAAIEAGGGRARFVRHDVTVEDEWAQIVDDVVASEGGLHVLFNNAGIFAAGSVEETTLEEWRRIQAVNLEGVFLGAKHGVRVMKACCPEGGPSGSIINTSSIAGIVASPLSAAYSMSKGGVRLFTKSLAIECAFLGYNIRVNSVHPGIIDTEMMKQVAHKTIRLGRHQTYEQAWESLVQRQPIGRMGTVEDIARGVVYLASDDSGPMNGAELVLDGGITAT